MFIVNDKIKLVIWDLDDTFWSGTISEEKIISSDYNIDLLKKLIVKFFFAELMRIL